MKLNLFVVSGCPTCANADDLLIKFTEEFPSHQLSVTDISKTKINSIPIVPALFIEEKLFSYGEIDEIKLKEYLKINE